MKFEFGFRRSKQLSI